MIETEEKRATKTKVKITTTARHFRHRNKPHPANRIGEQKNINITHEKKKRRNRKTTDNNSQAVWNNNWKMMGEMDKQDKTEETQQSPEEKKHPVETITAEGKR